MTSANDGARPSTAADERWLAATWPLVRQHLPAAPARVLEIGCGPLGGFVPALRETGYDAVGIDPQAPHGPGYQRIEVGVTVDDEQAAIDAGRLRPNGIRYAGRLAVNR